MDHIKHCGLCKRETKPDEWEESAVPNYKGIHYKCPACGNSMFRGDIGLETQAGWEFNKAVRKLLKILKD